MMVPFVVMATGAAVRIACKDRGGLLHLVHQFVNMFVDRIVSEDGFQIDPDIGGEFIIFVGFRALGELFEDLRTPLR